jgi:predicted RNase H-like nuclease (RuvC/YqgF family)
MNNYKEQKSAIEAYIQANNELQQLIEYREAVLNELKRRLEIRLYNKVSTDLFIDDRARASSNVFATFITKRLQEEIPDLINQAIVEAERAVQLATINLQGLALDVFQAIAAERVPHPMPEDPAL